MRLPPVRSKAPIAVAGLIAVPLYFAALMASSLALDKPHGIGKHIGPGSGGTEESFADIQAPLAFRRAVQSVTDTQSSAARGSSATPIAQ